MNPEIARHRAELEPLCRRYHVRRLELFGSAATDHYRPGESDLDFLVEFEPLPPGTYADTYFGLLESLEQLFGAPVDLVVASAIKNPYFRQSVEQNKTLVYAP
ncbi:MAG TPA: nucleotidyltransferase domain-containing protein [Candidatus Macondimonas sp.]|nr:nucleotidyltransferase domain-containing protein [Candidatus Macondimonas sp.]